MVEKYFDNVKHAFKKCPVDGFPVDLQAQPQTIPCYSFFKNVYLLDLQFCPDLLPLGVPECLARKIMLMIAKEKEGGMKENIQKSIKEAGVMR